MKELESELKKGNDSSTLELLLDEMQNLKQQNNQINKRLDKIEEKLGNADIYQEDDTSNYLDNKPKPSTKEFRNLLQRKPKEGADVSDISSIFGIKPRQAYNVKDRIVKEEDWIAEIPKANGKNRVVSKSKYLTKIIKRDYPDLPSQIYDKTGNTIANTDWQILFKAWKNHKMEVKGGQEEVEKLSNWFDYEL